MDPAIAPHAAERRRRRPPPTRRRGDAPPAEQAQVHQVQWARAVRDGEPLGQLEAIQPIQQLEIMATRVRRQQHPILGARYRLAHLMATPVRMHIVGPVAVVQRLQWLLVQAFWRVTWVLSC